MFNSVRPKRRYFIAPKIDCVRAHGKRCGHFKLACRAQRDGTFFKRLVFWPAFLSLEKSCHGAAAKLVHIRTGLAETAEGKNSVAESAQVMGRRATCVPVKIYGEAEANWPSASGTAHPVAASPPVRQSSAPFLPASSFLENMPDTFSLADAGA